MAGLFKGTLDKARFGSRNMRHSAVSILFLMELCSRSKSGARLVGQRLLAPALRTICAYKNGKAAVTQTCALFLTQIHEQKEVGCLRPAAASVAEFSN